ncbi:DNA polymerase III subunit delta [Candidatus Falkowbacteria bacterium]|nr:DNA polymerase III subunit delta [Candidatus Falkowbacteria bacterium]
MIFFLYGPDTYRSRQKLNELKAKFLADVDKSSLNLTVFEGKNLKPAEFRSAVSTPPFLARKRMVVITDLLGDNKNKDLPSEIIALLDNDKLLADVILIFWESGKVDRRTALFKRLDREKYVSEFALLSDSELKRWITTEIKKQNAKIEPAALERLLQLLGSDLWEVTTEVGKLAAYADGKTITVAEVNAFVKGKFDDNIFNFVDAISAKNQQRAYQLLSDQLDSGAHELYLLTMLIRQFRILLQVRSLLDEGAADAATVARELGLHPFVAKKSLVQVRHFSLDALTAIYQQLVATDLQIKTSRADARTLLDLLLIKIMS